MQWEYNRTNFDRNLTVVIGIDRYDSRGIHDLQTAVNDANAIANLLRDEYGYIDEHIVRLFSPKNDEATLKALNQPYRPATLDELRILLTDTLPNHLKPTPADRLLFYFAGHGIPRNSKDGPAGYLVPQTAEQGNPDSFLSMRELHDALSKLECHHLLVILDCCFAGTFRWASSRKAIPILETVHKEHYDRFIRYPAWQVLTSAAHDQEALDLSIDQRGSAIKDTRHSPFALALIEGLRDNKADVIQDKVITAHELYLYLDRRVNELSREMQTPGIYPMRLDYDRGEYIFTRPGFKRDDLTEAPPLNEENNPYRGLKPFEQRHSRFFFGRKALVEALSHRLTQSRRPLTVVLGASGSGKSSLVKAGLLPYLREKQKKDEQAQRWYILDPMRPGKSPFTELARTLLPVANSNLIAQLAQVSFLDKAFAEILDPNSEQKQKAASPNPTQPDSRERLSGNDAFDATKLAQCWHPAEPEAKLLLVVDYFAQLQRFCHQPQEQEQLSSLYRAIEQALNRLTQALQQEPQSFTHLMAIWSQANPSTKLLLVIDQFEELITMSLDDRGSGEQSDSQEPDEQKEWQHFLLLLRIALAKYRRQLHIVLTLRSDFEPRFLNSALKSHWKNARFPVRAMNSDELRDAIEGPALKQALYFEPPELVGKLIDEVGQMPGALPLLSFTLSELYIKLYERWTKDKSTDRALRIKDYDELGGVAGALTRRATQEYDNLVRNFGEASGKAYQATMRRVMLRMVTIEGGGVARRRVPESELKYSSREEDDRVTTVIERLVKARLLVKGQETGEPYVEPAHDFLVRGWDKLQSWIKERQEELILLRRLVFAVDDWVDNHRSEFFLWDDDPRIELLEEILESENNWLNKTELEFVISSLNQQEDELRKTREQLRISEKRRIEAEMREQTVVLLEQLPMQPVETLVSAIQLTGRYLDKLLGEPLSLVQTVLQQAVGLAKEQNMLLNADATYLAISLNGKYILQFGGCFALNLFEWNGNLLKEFSLIDFSESQGRAINIFTAVFSHDNQHIICSDDNGAIYVWDFNFNLIHSPFNPYGTSFIYAIAAHPTKDLIAIASINDDSGFIGIWNWQDNSVSNFFPIFRENFITSLAFSPDGSHILSGNCSDSGKAICLWDLKGNLVNGPLHYSDKTEESFSPKVLFGLNGDNLIVFDSPEVLVWDRQGNLLSKPLENIKSKARCVSISNTGDTICVIDKSGKVYLLDWQGNILNQDSPIKIFSDNINDELFSAIIHPTEPSILTSGSLLSEPPKIWDLRDYLIKHSKATRGEIRSITSVSEQLFASISSRREIQLWNWNGNLHKSFSLETSGSASIGASPDGKLIAIFDGCLKLWSCEGELIREMGGSCSTDFSIVGFSPDYQIIAVYNDSLNKGKVTLNRWSVQGELLSEFIYEDKDGSNVESRVENLTISSDCHYVCIVFQRRYGYIASVSEVKIVDIKNNSVSTLANHHATEDAIVTTTIFPQEITVAAFSPNGKHIATLAADNTLQIWDYEGNPVGKRFQLQDLGTAVTFSSDGRYIACGNAEGGVHLYDYKGSLIGNFSGNTSRIGGIAFSPDGQTLVSGDYSGTLRLYRVHWKAWLQLACDRLRFHPVFKEPQTEMSQQACKTCTDHIWNGTDLLEIFVSKGNSESKARQLTISTLIEKGQKLAQIGRIEAAIAAYTQAQELDPEVEIPASAWGELAWFAGLHGYASSPEIRAACEKAVESAPTDSAWRDSRGLVRTINGDIKGAIEDFQAFIKWTPDKTKKRQFQRWLNKLRSGVSPFTAGELERLRKLVELEKLTAPDENY